MLSLPPGIQVFMAIEPVDMRKSFDGLSAAVQTVFARNVLDGHLFFQTILKILKGRPTVYADIRSELRRNKLYASLSDFHVDPILDTLTALVAQARRIDAESGDAASSVATGPLLCTRQD